MKGLIIVFSYRPTPRRPARPSVRRCRGYAVCVTLVRRTDIQVETRASPLPALRTGSGGRLISEYFAGGFSHRPSVWQVMPAEVWLDRITIFSNPGTAKAIKKHVYKTLAKKSKSLLAPLLPVELMRSYC